MSLDLEQRRARDLLRRKIAEIEAPTRKAQKDRAREARKVQRKAVHVSAAPNKRQPRVKDNAYLAHVRRQPCTLAHLGEGCEGHIDAAHLRYSNPKVGRTNPGMGNKSDDRWTLPLCRKHHTEQHAAGNEARWWSGKGVDPDAECLARRAAYEARSQT